MQSRRLWPFVGGLVAIIWAVLGCANAADFVGDGMSALGRSLGGAIMSGKSAPEALILNPAAITTIKQTTIQTAYNYQYGGSLNQYFVAAALPLGQWTLGAAMPIDQVPDILRTQENSGSGIGESIGSVSQLYAAGLLTAAVQLNPALALGVTSRFYYLSLDTYQGLGAGADLGLRWQCGAQSALGLSVRHLGGTTIQWNTGATETYATQYALGYSTKLQIDGIGLAAEADATYQSSDGAVGCRAGVEAGLAQFLFLRGGYASQSAEASVGLGLVLPELSLDYALVNHDPLGISHQVMMSFRL